VATPTDAQIVFNSAAAESGVAMNMGQYMDAIQLLIQAEGITGGDTLTPEATLNGADWYTIEGQKMSDGTDVVSIAADGMYRFYLPGVTAFRLTKVGTAGTVVATARAVRA
jgi:hypothetical protein